MIDASISHGGSVGRRTTGLLAALLAGFLAAPAAAQDFAQRGFFEVRNTFYPQAAPGDSGRLVAEGLLRWESAYRPASWLTINTSLDARTDSHRQTRRTWNLDIDGRNIQRPAFSVRRLSANIIRGRWTVELGRQFVRWGKADILNPTDRFAPKDYLSSIVDTDFLGINAARATYTHGLDSLELVWQPRFTPTRTPLLDQRWTALPPEAEGIAIRDQGARYPGGSQFGARYNHIGNGYEASISYFDGRQNLPSFDGTLTLNPSPSVNAVRVYPRLRLIGSDAAVPLRWFTVKGEAAYLTSPTPGAEEYALYVIQLERFVGEWSFVGGYAGSNITRPAANPLQFAADRGIAKSFVGRAGLTIDVNRSAAVETVILSGGSFVRFEYSQAAGQHWRTTATAAWIRGDMSDFLGQYNRNSYASLAIRYSF